MNNRILCVYVTRQIDSNLMMASTVFRGLFEGGYKADMIFMGSEDAIIEFKSRYERYFNKVYYKCICPPLKDNSLYRKAPLLYSYMRHFVLDGLRVPSIKWLKEIKFTEYDKILSFIPPVISGAYAIKIKKQRKLDIPLVQFWTDPLSLGRLNDIAEIPKSRFLHIVLERRLLYSTFVDKIVFCYPLLCEMESKLHPEAAKKMTWSDVSYLPHNNLGKEKNKRPLIGLFGAYQKHVRNIEPLLSAIKELPEFDFIIRGDGDLPFKVDEIKNLDLKSGRIPLKDVEDLEASCDVLLSLGGKSGITHPAGKTFYYADYNKPIIHIGDGVHWQYFQEYLSGFGNRFIHCHNDVDSIVNGIKQVVDGLSDFQLTIPTRMIAMNIAKKIVEIKCIRRHISDLTAGGGKSSP